MGNSRFSDGLFLGALLGGAAVFLLGTEKGNKVLKVLTQEGMAELNNLLEEIDQVRKQAADIAEEEQEEMEEEFEDTVVETPKSNGESHTASNPKSTKRFFKKSR
jgi:hypothetical protein